MNWHVTGASAYSEAGAADASCSLAERADRGRGRRAVALQKVDRRLLRDGVVLDRVRGVHRVDIGVPVTPVTGLPSASTCASWISIGYTLAT